MVLDFYVTNVILTNYQTGADVHFIVRTKTDRFSAICRAIGKARRAWPGYEIFETW